KHGHFCQEIVTVSPAEAAVLSEFGFPRAKVVGTCRAPMPTPSSFEQRSGLVFVGSLYAENTPNYDSLTWFIEEILPRVEEELGWETRLGIAGYVAPGLPLDRFLTHSRVTWHGPVADLTPIYDSYRIAIAPTRFAAGTPYKVYEAASFGIPVVLTDLLLAQLGWQNGREVLSVPVDDAAGFAKAIVHLYRSQQLWQSLREKALENLALNHNEGIYKGSISQIILPYNVKAKRKARSKKRVLSNT
ncbi:glycosyltransferase family 4 protein, partial [Labrys sp. LIt4]|uniref:glycosyltransferase family 4 protein n=1 Tax=Labrys sp. LIt4 TaxID=2821355 RepID=UPI001ADF4290